MGGEYSGGPPGAGRSDTLLALDTSSPVLSLAVGAGGRLRVVRSGPQRTASRSLLTLVDEAMAEAGTSLRSLGACVVVRGPGSFTGIRVGLSTVLALHQATSLPVAPVDALTLLAVAAKRPGHVLAAVDALRGEWLTQRFETAPGLRPRPLEEPSLRPGATLAEVGADAVCGFGVGGLPIDPEAAVEPLELASAALHLFSEPPPSDVAGLTRPLYSRPAAARPTDGASSIL